MISIQINSTLTAGNFYRTESLQDGRYRIQVSKDGVFDFEDLVVPISSIDLNEAPVDIDNPKCPVDRKITSGRGRLRLHLPNFAAQGGDRLILGQITSGQATLLISLAGTLQLVADASVTKPKPKPKVKVVARYLVDGEAAVSLRTNLVLNCINQSTSVWAPTGTQPLSSTQTAQLSRCTQLQSRQSPAGVAAAK